MRASVSNHSFVRLAGNPNRSISEAMKYFPLSLHLHNSVKLVVQLLLTWAAFLGLWLVFVYQITAAELMVGSTASALALVAGYAGVHAVPDCFTPRFRWVVQVWRLPGMVLQDLWVLVADLGRTLIHRPARSGFLRTAFPRSRDHCDAAAQQGLAVLYVSTAPNSVVVHIDNHEMLFHQIEPAPVPKLVERLRG